MLEPFYVLEPELPKALPIVASIPHGGTYLPPGYVDRLATLEMRGLPMTDWYMAELFDFLPQLGVTVIAATYSRFVVDLNRPPGGRPLYPGRFETGLVPTEAFDGSAVFADPPNDREIGVYREQVYDPYHEARRHLLGRRSRGGRVIQLDLHSVAPFATLIHPALTHSIFLGDRDGRSCHAWLTDTVHQAYERASYSVVSNAPYKGGWITASMVGDPSVEALQIEMNQAVYMDPEEPGRALGSVRFAEARDRLKNLYSDLLPELVDLLETA